MVWPVVAAIAGLASTGSAISSSRKGAEAAKEAGRRSAMFIMEETREGLRRQDLADYQDKGLGEAIRAASGLRRGGDSSAQYLDFLDAERQKARAWTLRAGKLRASAARKGANVTASQMTSQGRMYAFQGISTFAAQADRGFGTAKPSGGTAS